VEFAVKGGYFLVSKKMIALLVQVWREKNPWAIFDERK
jgi:hypothetical protein